MQRHDIFKGFSSSLLQYHYQGVELPLKPPAGSGQCTRLKNPLSSEARMALTMFSTKSKVDQWPETKLTTERMCSPGEVGQKIPRTEDPQSFTPWCRLHLFHDSADVIWVPDFISSIDLIRSGVLQMRTSLPSVGHLSHHVISPQKRTKTYQRWNSLKRSWADVMDHFYSLFTRKWFLSLHLLGEEGREGSSGDRFFRSCSWVKAKVWNVQKQL